VELLRGGDRVGGRGFLRERASRYMITSERWPAHSSPIIEPMDSERPRQRPIVPEERPYISVYSVASVRAGRTLIRDQARV
jgi:hypothetical protein